MKFDFKGLSTSDVEASRRKYGTNELPAPEVETFWAKLIENFDDPLIKILLLALVVTMFLAFLGFCEWYEGVGIFMAVFLATFVSTYSEFKNEASFQQLQLEASRVQNRVFRNGELNSNEKKEREWNGRKGKKKRKKKRKLDVTKKKSFSLFSLEHKYLFFSTDFLIFFSLPPGKVENVFVNDIVRGDHVLLQAGDKVPADGRLLVGEVGAVQSVLTGEPDAVRKTVNPYAPAAASSSSGGSRANDADDDSAASSSRAADELGFSDPHRVFRGSVIDDGEGVLLVDAVGLQTHYGKLFEELGKDEDRESPLQVKLSNLADGISMIGYVGATLIAVSFLFKQFVMDNHYQWASIVAYASNWQLALKDVVTSLMLAIIIIVVAVPEGLPMMIAIVLSLNMRKLLKANVLVRKLLGIETAGSLNLLFLDKTGTITRGRFDAQLFLGADGSKYTTAAAIPATLRTLLTLVLRESTSAQVSADGTLVGGNASDRALLSFVGRDGSSDGIELVREALFTSVRKFSGAEVRLSAARAKALPATVYDKQTRQMSLVKGAPEVIVAGCARYIDPDGQLRALDARAVNSDVDELSANGLRVVAVAVSAQSLVNKHGGGGAASLLADSLPADMVLLGFVGILDETRPESRGAVASCRNAGIQVVMITGDRQQTADAVARDIRLHSDAQRESITSAQLNKLSDAEVKALLPRLAVVARALPTDKSRLVRLAQETGRVVGMTGDGVNDSSALKRADVGFAMGSGSEVAKEAADIVILDDNFKSIAMAVLYGRTIFRSIRKFIVFQSTVNFSSSVIVFLGPFLGFDFPLTLIQLLWINLVMDTFAALAFGGEPALERYMRDPPIPREAAIVSGDMWTSIIFNGLYIAVLSIVFLLWPPMRELYRPDDQVFLTAFFCLFIFLTTCNSFNVRTSRLNLITNLFENVGFLGIQALIFVVQIVFTVIGGKVLRTVALTSNEWFITIALATTVIPFDLLRKVIFLPFVKSKADKDD
jgi:calcium-translocating P-type ATPase